MLGAPMETITLLHHAEAIARVRGQAEGHVPRRGGRRGRAGVHRHRDLRGRVRLLEPRAPDEDEFKVIAGEALEAGIGVRGPTGEGQSHLFPAPELTRFGVAWLEERFG